MNVPKPFAFKHLGCEVNQHQLIKLVAPDGTQWEVACSGYSNKFSFSKGWIIFARNIGLNVGDICIYELINPKNHVLKVHVVKRSQVYQEHCNQVCNDGNKGRTKLRHSPRVSLKKSNIKVNLLDSEDDKNSSNNDEMHNEREYSKLGYARWMKKYKGVTNVITGAGISLPENPFFLASIKPYNLKGGKYLNIPRPFGEEHLRCKVNEGKFIKLMEPDGTQREVYCLRDSVQFSFRQGWGIFAQDIGLNVGDICIFEVTNSKESVLKVHVVKRSHDTSEVLHDYHEHHHQGRDSSGEKSPEIWPSPSVSLKKPKAEITLLDSEEDQRVGYNEYTKFRYPLWMRKYERLINIVTASGISLPENPFFLAAIKLYNLEKGVLNVPKPFGQKLQEIRHQLIQLEAPDGTLWEVTCCRDPMTFAFGLYKGWKIFARGVGLNIGDICFFELVDAEKYLLKVHIVKRSQIKTEEHII